MDRGPEKLPNTASRLIAMAASLVGGAEAVRRAMVCSPEDFQNYCSGLEEPPYAELDRLVTLIIVEQQKIIDRNHDFLAKMRGKQDQA